MKKQGFGIVGLGLFMALIAGSAYAQQAVSATPSAVSAAAPTALAGDKVELKIELPKAVLDGTPKNMPSKHLDPATGTKRDPFMVPKGVVLLSKGKPVGASDKEPVMGDLPMVTDGDKEGGNGSFIEFGPGVQWEQVDLGAAAEIYAVLIWHFHSQARIYRDVIVQVSDDPSFTKEVKTLFNNDDDNSSKLGVGSDYEYVDTNEGRLVDGKGVKGRYVRCYSNGNTSNDMNHLIEIEVFGRPVK